MKTGTMDRSQGSTFISVVIFSVILFALSGGFLLLMTNEYSLSRRSYESVAAMHLAEAGAEYAIWAIKLPTADDLSVTKWAGADPKTNSIASFQTSAGKTIGAYDIAAHGLSGQNPYVDVTSFVPNKTSPRARRSVRVGLQAGSNSGPFSMGFFGNDSVTVTGSCLTDSYDSRNGVYGSSNRANNCDIETNGTSIAITGSVSVNGDVKCLGNGAGAISISGSGPITGNISTRGTTGAIVIADSRTINGNISTTGTTNSSIRISGSATINGDVSTAGTSSGAINISGSAQVHGDAATGPGGTATLSGSAAISGTTTHTQAIEAPEPAKPMTPVTVPSSLTSLSLGINGQWTDGLLTKTGSGAAAPIPAGNWKLQRIKLTGSTSLTIGADGQSTNIYLTGNTLQSIIQSGSSQIICRGTVTIYVDGTVDGSGSGIWNQSNTPPNFQIYGTPTCTDIKISGSTTFYGAVYAPAAAIHITGSNASYGSFIGKTIDANGSVGFHYDEALVLVGGGTASGFTVTYWEEKG